MCGIVGGIAQRDVGAILLEGLKRLEYRGYDSAGVAVVGDGELERVRVVGKVRDLSDTLLARPLHGGLGIAHTRWATHGKPSLVNAHPHACGGVALVHNGIVENYQSLRERLLAEGTRFESETDSEVVLHEVRRRLAAGRDLLRAVQETVQELHGAFAIGVISAAEPDRLVAARSGSPLVIGIGIGEHFIASDVYALLPVTQRFIVLQDGDVADLRRDRLDIYDRSGQRVTRPVFTSELSADAADKAGYRHYMLKEIFMQPAAVAETLEGRIEAGKVREDAFGPGLKALLDGTRNVHIVACGTSYHAGLIARYWLETLAGVPCSVEVASEYRHRRPLVPPGTLFVAISQSGETADTLAALQLARDSGYVGTLGICNVPESSLTREADVIAMTRAGPELSVASTKAFTTQLTVLLMLVVLLGRRHGLGAEPEARLTAELESLPGHINQALELNATLEHLAERFVNRHHTLYLGRGSMLPVAMEGALKLKEISYIHAEAYPAGELKHGPLALVDEEMPVVAVAPDNDLLRKLEANLQEVRARGGQLYVFTDANRMQHAPGVHVIGMPKTGEVAAPLLYTVALQLLAYHVAVLKGADVDQPRNLAKSVTVE